MSENILIKHARNLIPPRAVQKPLDLVHHGITRTDPWFWLRERNSNEVIDYLHAENNYSDQVLAPVSDLKEKIYDEIVGRIRQTDMSVPFRLDAFIYYVRYEDGKQYPIHCRKSDSQSPEQIILDVNTIASNHDYCSVSGLKLSRSHRYLAYGEDYTGRRQYTLRVKDLQTGEMLPDVIPNTSSEFAWADDEKTLFYVLKNEETLRPWKVMRHILGTSNDSDVCVFEDPDESFYVSLSKSKSRKFIFIGCHSTNVTEYLFVPANQPETPFRIFYPRTNDHEYSLEHDQEGFLILSNWDAKNFRLMRCTENETDRKNWVEIIPHRDSVLLEGVETFDAHLVLSERVRGLNMIRIIRKTDGADHYLEFKDQAYSAWVDTNLMMDSHILRFGFNSLTTPPSVFDYDMDSRTMTLLKQEEVVGGHDPSHYVSERIFVPSHDGTEVPVSIVYKNSFRKDASHPLYLVGYGSYGSSYDPYFSSARLSLLDRGFAYAIAHVRGGEEMGRSWYEDGRMLKKKNTFLDFISVADHLIQNGYCKSETLVINGGSAGGLLIGAVINMRPELFGVAVADVPFVDVVTTMLDDSIPLTVGEYTEWGNPNEKEYFDYMLEYSPYDNVKAQPYPHLLVTSGYHDSQVQYWEPTKWVAKIRDRKTNDNLVLLHTEMQAGHSGKSGRFERYRQIAMEWAFVCGLLNK